jgi:hypothetical protein
MNIIDTIRVIIYSVFLFELLWLVAHFIKRRPVRKRIAAFASRWNGKL